MKKTGYIIVALLISCGGKNNKSKDNTSKIEQTVSVEKENLGNWTINNYVDDFNDKTGRQYISSKRINGIFSSSETTDSNLDVIIVADTNFIEIKLFEYRGIHQVELTGNIVFKVRTEEGEVIKVKTLAGYTFREKPYTSDSLLRVLLSDGGDIKFNATVTKYGNESNYSFIVNADHFQEAFEKINKK